jgi:hypothetical protein
VAELGRHVKEVSEADRNFVGQTETDGRTEADRKMRRARGVTRLTAGTGNLTVSRHTFRAPPKTNLVDPWPRLNRERGTWSPRRSSQCAGNKRDASAFRDAGVALLPGFCSLRSGGRQPKGLTLRETPCACARRGFGSVRGNSLQRLGFHLGEPNCVGALRGRIHRHANRGRLLWARVSQDRRCRSWAPGIAHKPGRPAPRLAQARRERQG